MCARSAWLRGHVFGVSPAAAWQMTLPYFERQDAQQLRCGVHALNHAIGHPEFAAEDLDEGAERVVEEAQAIAIENNRDCLEQLADHKWPNGYYSEQAMAKALEIHSKYRFDQTPLQYGSFPKSYGRRCGRRNRALAWTLESDSR